MENPGFTLIYDYKFEVEAATSVPNIAGSTSIALAGQTLVLGYGYLSATYRSYTLENILWSYTEKAYIFSLHLNFDALPVTGNDLIIFQRINGVTNKLAIILGR
jgi:hypothetical protein